MILHLVLLGVGVAFIYVGAEGMVWGGIKLASYFHVAPLIIGLSVLAFGTSLPEFTVSVYSVVHGMQDVAVGNVIGSNIANIALILATSAVIFPVAAHYEGLRLDIFVVLGITTFFMVLSMDGLISHLDGFLLVGGIALYLFWLTRRSKVTHGLDTAKPGDRPGRYFFAIFLGLAALGVGAQVFTNSAVAIARMYGISELTIGATLVAIGTSIPELATSLVAAFRRQSGMVIGNILGSNVFNLLAVLGVISIAKPIQVPTQAIIYQIPLMFVLTAALLPAIKYRKGIDRKAGFVFLGVYVLFTYVIYLVDQA